MKIRKKMFAAVMFILIADAVIACTTFSFSDKIHNRNGFQEYTYEANFKLMEYVVANVDFLKNNVPEEAIIASAKYPETIICVNKWNQLPSY